MEKETVTVVTDATGTGTGYTTRGKLQNRLMHIAYKKVNYSNGSTITITAEDTGQNIWTQTGVNASVVKTPRIPTHLPSGLDNLAGPGMGNFCDFYYIVGERLKVVVTNGGADASGQFTFICE